MATIVEDMLDWYGIDEYGGAVHDVIGTRCDPYTARLLSGTDYHHCCHSNSDPRSCPRTWACLSPRPSLMSTTC